MSADGDMLVISPVRNERSHIERVIRAVAGQTRPPDLWIVVDDGSDDGTLEILQSMEEDVPFMRVLPTSGGETLPAARDRLRLAAAPRAWNRGLRAADWRHFAFLGKLDGDIELPPDYYETLLAKFEADPQLGIACGNLLEPRGSGWKKLTIPAYHVHGALKLYRRACFEAVGGVQERQGWDMIDETHARMKGFATRSYQEPLALHHRPVASASGPLRGQARHGQSAYISHYYLLWVALRSIKVASVTRPRVLSGAAFVIGYLLAAIRRTPRVDDENYRRHVRRELRQRLTEPLKYRRRPRY
jgi:poly-beta-1,6-N-acetyl-D-glucosamine synthase